MEHRTAEIIYWDVYHHHGKPFYCAASERGICGITLGNETEEEFAAWLCKKFRGAVMVRSSERLHRCASQLDEYFSGQRRVFDLPLDLRGTPFQQRVWSVLQEIPYGETRSYLDVARQIGNEKAVRAVGSAAGANPVPVIVPCHRVIGHDGSLTGFGGGLDLKQEMLALEQGRHGTA
jgi:methylated-DNA-[protein]-cysteine S-methyltransferase